MDEKKIKKALILNSPAIVLGLLGNWISYTVRVPYGGNMATAIGAIMESPAVMLSALPLSLNLTDIAVGVGIGMILVLLMVEKRSNRKTYRKGVEHGSARWGTPEDSLPYKDEVLENNIILSQTEYLTLNGRPANPKYARNKNVICIGGSGSGKTRFFIKPNLMQLHSSYVVTDPKGTIVNELGTMLVKNGYELKIFNLINFNKSLRYNPLAYVKDEKDILKLVETLIANTKGEGSQAGEDFWVKAEKLLYQALIGAIITDFPKFERNFNTLVELIKLMEVREDDETFKNSVDLYFEDLESRNPKSYAVTQYKNYKLASGKTAKSILISCASRLAPFNIPQVQDLVKEDEMELEKLGDKKTALFVIIPETDRTFNFIVSMMYTQMFNLLCTHADDDCGGRLPVHVRCLLDEFANIGMIPNFDILIATIRSREISANIVLQSTQQLDSVYGKEKGAIIRDNCDTTVFLGGKSKETMKDLVELIGKQTIDDYNTSDTRGSNLSKGLNYSKLGRDLMTLDEMAIMDGGKCIVQIRGARPFFSDKYDLCKHPKYAYHASDKRDENGKIVDKKWFDVERFVNQQHKTPISMKALRKAQIGKTVRIRVNKEIVNMYEEDEVKKTIKTDLISNQTNNTHSEEVSQGVSE